jgi:hypothetical protein
MGFHVAGVASARGCDPERTLAKERRSVHLNAGRRSDDCNGRADGVLQPEAVTTALTAASEMIGRPAKLLGVASLSSGDRSGLSTFVFGLGLLLPSVIGGVGIFVLGMGLRLW